MKTKTKTELKINGHKTWTMPFAYEIKMHNLRRIVIT